MECDHNGFYNPYPNPFVTAAGLSLPHYRFLVVFVCKNRMCDSLQGMGGNLQRCRPFPIPLKKQRILIGAANPSPAIQSARNNWEQCYKSRLSSIVWAALTFSLALCLSFALLSETWVLVVMSIEALVILLGLGQAEDLKIDSGS